MTLKMLPEKTFVGGTVVMAVLLTGFLLVPNVLSDDDNQGRNSGNMDDRRPGADRLVDENARNTIEEGRRTFRFDTFGDQLFWGDTIKLHQAIAGGKLGGVGAGVRQPMLCRMWMTKPEDL